MTEHRTIPAVDPAFVAEVGKLTDEANATMRHVMDLSDRVGIVMAQMDELKADHDDETVDRLRDATGYPDLLNTMFVIAGWAAAAADHLTDMPSPSWYAELLDRRRARSQRVA